MNYVLFGLSCNISRFREILPFASSAQIGQTRFTAETLPSEQLTMPQIWHLKISSLGRGFKLRQHRCSFTSAHFSRSYTTSLGAGCKPAPSLFFSSPGRPAGYIRVTSEAICQTHACMLHAACCNAAMLEELAAPWW